MNLKLYSQHLKESILDTPHDNLSTDLWDKKEKLHYHAKVQILDIFNSWKNKIKLTADILGIKLTGSMSGFQYNDFSDIDINVELNISEDKRLRLIKILPNGQKLNGTEHPINFYLSVSEETRDVQQSIYDVIEDKWIKKPSKISEENPEEKTRLYYMSGLEQAISWGRKISLDIDELKRNAIELQIYNHYLENDEFHSDEKELLFYIENKKSNIRSSYDTIRMDLHMIKNFRQEAFISGGSDPFMNTFGEKKISHPDYSINNIVYKILEKFGYLDQLHKIKEKYLKLYPEILDDSKSQE